MKEIFLAIVLVLSILSGNFNPPKARSFKVSLIQIDGSHKSDNFNKSKYEEVINFIKKHEGFRSKPYSDGGWPCIGYGQRLAFFPNYTIKDSITIHEADSILRLSFDNHVELVKIKFPGLKTTQIYSVAHMSYSIGIGTVLKAGYLYRDNNSWKINQLVLLNYREVDRTRRNYRENRLFEYHLFNI